MCTISKRKTYIRCKGVLSINLSPHNHWDQVLVWLVRWVFPILLKPSSMYLLKFCKHSKRSHFLHRRILTFSVTGYMITSAFLRYLQMTPQILGFLSLRIIKTRDSKKRLQYNSISDLQQFPIVPKNSKFEKTIFQ